ncbi:MAG: AtpZ/AtpI family protein [Deltaproteobacteria bacterium]|nr:AtpZ/AtpI family protein [Deltaproteobacteria bacterium]MBI3293726.1 AtpZ/AtpI family protein [Deltaproteobacteria bacterium]
MSLLDPKYSRLMAVYSSAAMVKLVLFVGAFFGGNLLDKKLGTSPLFLLIFLMAAMGLGIWYIIALMKRRL